MVDIGCSFFKGTTEALCMRDPLCDIVPGNVLESKLPSMPHFTLVGVFTRS